MSTPIRSLQRTAQSNYLGLLLRFIVDGWRLFILNFMIHAGWWRKKIGELNPAQAQLARAHQPIIVRQFDHQLTILMIQKVDQLSPFTVNNQSTWMDVVRGTLKVTVWWKRGFRLWWTTTSCSMDASATSSPSLLSASFLLVRLIRLPRILPALFQLLLCRSSRTEEMQGSTVKA